MAKYEITDITLTEIEVINRVTAKGWEGVEVCLRLEGTIHPESFILLKQNLGKPVLISGYREWP